MKATGADVITVQSALKPNATQDLLYLFGPEFDHFITHGSDLTTKTAPKVSTAILWRKDKYKAKAVNVKSLAGTAASTFLSPTESSLTMAHLWSEAHTSLTIVSWTPDASRRSGLEERTKLCMLESLLRFLSLFRRGQETRVKMRFVICGHFGCDVTKANFGPFPYFKYYNLVKPNHVRSDIFVSPFIFSEDSLKANEKGGKI